MTTETLIRDATKRAAAGHLGSALHAIQMTREEFAEVLRGPSDHPRAVELLGAIDNLPRRRPYKPHAPGCTCDACDYVSDPRGEGGGTSFA